MARVPLRTALFALAWASAFTLATSSSSGAERQVKVLVRFRVPPGQAEVGTVGKYGGRVTRQFELVPAVAATVPAASMERLRGEPGVAAVELDGSVQAHDLDSTWGAIRIGCGPVHEGALPAEGATPVLGAGVRVAVLDTGVDYLHPQLTPNFRGGYDFVNDDSDPWDDHYHGTHVAGTIAAIRDGYGPLGVAPEVQLYGVKVLGADGNGSWSSVIAGMDWCVRNRIQVANLSLGSSSDPGSTVRAAFDNAYAAGVVVVASAGNSGAGVDTVGYPARYASVIAVGSTTSTDARSSFSSVGPSVELAAPGSSIYSTYPGNAYAYLSGTSMAAPHVAGTAALALAAGVLDHGGDGRVNDDVRRTLAESAEDLGAAGIDDEFGFGLVDAEAAVTLAFAETPPSDPEPEPQPRFEAPDNLAGTVAGSQATLTWLDRSDVEAGFTIECWSKVRNKTTLAAAWTAGVDAASFATPALADGDYRFRVQAFRTVGSPATTAWSNEIQLSVNAGGKGSKGGKGGGKP